MKKIAILMATYNGARFVVDQINSIVNQTYYDWQLIARDDGSTDGTLDILCKIAEKHPDKIKIIQDINTNLGVVGNFSRLLELCPDEYIMFSDQDDVWLENKIETLMCKMQELEVRYGSSTPILIHTDLKVVNDNMKVIAGSFWRYQLLDPKITALNRLLIQNHITGCTMIINRALKEQSLPIPEGIVMHDWWIALVASGFGVIEAVPSVTMLYRQHGENVEGAKEWNLFRHIKELIMGLLHFENRKSKGKTVLLQTQKQAKIFLERYKHRLDNNVKEMAEAYANLDKMGCILKRVCFLKFHFFQKGFWRNVALFFKI